MTLLHLETLAKHPERLPVRVDLRVRNRRGSLIYTGGPRPLEGELTAVKIVSRRSRGRGLLKFLTWYFTPDPGVTLPRAAREDGEHYAQVLLGGTSRGYFLLTLDDRRWGAARHD